jgi:hypothetical protein
MKSTAQGTVAGLPPSRTPDLREIPLGDLAELVESGDSAVQDAVATLADHKAQIRATMFSSSI